MKRSIQADLKSCLTTKRQKFTFSVIISMVVVCSFFSFKAFKQPATDLEHYAHLHRLGRIYKITDFAEEILPDSISSLLRISKLQTYCNDRTFRSYEALLSSGYFVESSLPFRNLQANQRSVESALTSTFRETGAYYLVSCRTNEVVLVCRREDLFHFKKALEAIELLNR